MRTDYKRQTLGYVLAADFTNFPHYGVYSESAAGTASLTFGTQTIAVQTYKCSTQYLTRYSTVSVRQSDGTYRDEQEEYLTYVANHIS